MFSHSECFTIRVRLGTSLNVAGWRNSFSILCRGDLPAAKSPSLPPSVPSIPSSPLPKCVHALHSTAARAAGQAAYSSSAPLRSSLPSSFLCLSKPSPPSPRGPFRLRRKCHLWRTGVAHLPNIISHGRESLRLAFNIHVGGCIVIQCSKM